MKEEVTIKIKTESLPYFFRACRYEEIEVFEYTEREENLTAVTIRLRSLLDLFDLGVRFQYEIENTF